MGRPRLVIAFTGGLVCLMTTTGCGGFVARRIIQAPNSYPAWVAPDPRVELAFSPRFLAGFDRQVAEVGPPPAQLTYRIVDPGSYGLRVVPTRTVRRGEARFKFSFAANVPGQSIAATAAPRGTVVLLHGYGLAQFSTVPWALRLAEEGWRCVLVDLRGHGSSSGKQVHFGLTETNDLTQLLNTLERRDQLVTPVAVMGESYGAALALRWQSVEPRVGPVIALAPYARLSTAILNIREEYAPWFPKPFLRAGLRKLPALLQADPGEIDTLTVLARHPASALFVAGADDRITPVPEVRRLFERAAAGSRMLVIPGATHEALSYFFEDLVPPVLEWLDQTRDAITRTNPEPDSESTSNSSRAGSSCRNPARTPPARRPPRCAVRGPPRRRSTRDP